jgi:hypothetical protein
MPTPRPTYVITVTDARPNDPAAGPIASRLRRALKVLLRSFDLRCLKIEPGPVPPPGTLAEASQNAGEADGTRDALAAPDATPEPPV